MAGIVVGTSWHRRRRVKLQHAGAVHRHGLFPDRALLCAAKSRLVWLAAAILFLYLMARYALVFFGPRGSGRDRRRLHHLLHGAPRSRRAYVLDSMILVSGAWVTGLLRPVSSAKARLSVRHPDAQQLEASRPESSVEKSTRRGDASVSPPISTTASCRRVSSASKCVSRSYARSSSGTPTPACRT